MNEQLQQALAALLNKTVAGVEAGASFLQAEIPEVIMQLLLWKASVSAISMAAFMLLSYLIYRFNKAQVAYWRKIYAENEYHDWEDSPQILLNAAQFFLVFPLYELWSIDWLQIIIAPKIYLIEYAASLAK